MNQIKFDISEIKPKRHRTKEERLEINNKIIEIINSHEKMPIGARIIETLQLTHPDVKPWYVYDFLKSLRSGTLEQPKAV